jgi:hypothetical protein
VPGLTSVRLGDTLQGEIQRILEKKVGVRIESFVPLEDRDDGLFELYGLHELKYANFRNRVKVV